MGGNFYGKVTREKALGSGALEGRVMKNKATPRKLLEAWGARRLTFKQSFLTLAIVIGAHLIFCWRDCSVHSRILNSITGLNQLNTTTPPPSCDYETQLLPEGGKYPLGVKLPLTENL